MHRSPLAERPPRGLGSPTRSRLLALAVTVGLGVTVGLAGCSSGIATTEASVDGAQGGVTLTVTTEGKNTFGAHGVECTARGDESCTLFLPAKVLQGGWNELTLETKRRTDEPVVARFYVGEELFAADCSAAASKLSPDPAEMEVHVTCRFPEGFRGELDGEPMTGGSGTIAADRCVGDVPTLAVDLERPLLRGAVPLDVVNEAGGRMRRPLPVPVPAPVVQVAVDDWADPWFEEELPLRLRAEPGATLHVDGTQIAAGDGMSVTVPVAIARGANTVTVEARRPGRAPAVHVLSIEGRYPDTPLHLDQTFDGPVTTTEPLLELTGTTHPRAKLYLSGRLMDHTDGRFALLAEIEEGRNDVQLLAVVDRAEGQDARPLTRIDIEVFREASAAAQARRDARPRGKEVALSAVAADPWEHVDARVRFPMTLDEIVQTPSLDGRCSALLNGTACTRRVSAPVMIGWSIRKAWVCTGDEVPIVVEAKTCPGAEPGDELEVAGTVAGALAGRHRGVTRDRPRVVGESFELLPPSEDLPRAEWPKPLPRLLAEGTR